MADDRHKSDIIGRLKSIEGHVRAVQRMVEDDEYCIDVLKQSLAVQGAIDRVNNLILERHLKTCVTTAIRSEEQSERERVIGELMQLFQGGSHVGWNLGQTVAPSMNELISVTEALPSPPALSQREREQDGERAARRALHATASPPGRGRRPRGRRVREEGARAKEEDARMAQMRRADGRKLERATLPITGMTCASCVVAVESALTEIPGVEACSVNLASRRHRSSTIRW